MQMLSDAVRDVWPLNWVRTQLFEHWVIDIRRRAQLFELRANLDASGHDAMDRIEYKGGIDTHNHLTFHKLNAAHMRPEWGVVVFELRQYRHNPGESFQNVAFPAIWLPGNYAFYSNSSSFSWVDPSRRTEALSA